ncbi:ribosomal protein S18 acetylase RimI-like enzyme [Breznakia sp. PF5-3]|uniref:GNAT family N-acetyltransferase n=1 Tax=unclassified Breznakia TaxID=2623764 RepID=UPI002404DFFF|nr:MULTISPECIES: GNAT family N-acetyltransferase [unclassified Breznakia]MDL2276127.1 GNAT family N-acetyltransferase [Breznakia sp. OttesenSCG-928-G09]MDF9824425.1 ribosomal protein S18 acetylase RimI-like enzyme [Breznakia sp. PM6-1]MDF9835154.1 ribosomal protein S18 acetylase RimI-like enzyme [Breznakia sp. PF5-3]MDF9838321.1 ribosomal protein S18 acetylase RimI-like enzyme [Breznakia sp. PFB2-8]MDF9860337.1 ribosomal protein S18 acetylase RimI-like enzyme [Breznakia sp. PH5-24]
MLIFEKLNKKDTYKVQAIVEAFRNQKITSNKANDILNNPFIFVYACLDNDIAAGYVLAYVLPRMDNGNDMMMIYHVFVQESYQRKHIASRLVEMALADAKLANMHYTFLITQEDNTAANKLYQKLGGELHTENKNVYYWYNKTKP